MKFSSLGTSYYSYVVVDEKRGDIGGCKYGEGFVGFF
jgi:hypothetical protein